MHPGLPIRPSLVLAAFLEPLLGNRDILVLGSALSELPEQLLERGARAVHVVDTDAARVASALARWKDGKVSFSTLDAGSAALGGSLFDIAMVERLDGSKPQIAVRFVHQLLSRRGLALFASPNLRTLSPLLPVEGPAQHALDYYTLYDTVAAEFANVRMLGQAPFVGYAIADFAPHAAPEPALDTGFVPGGAEEPDWFIALASESPPRLDEFLVVQLPTHRMIAAVLERASASPALAELLEDEDVIPEPDTEDHIEIEAPSGDSFTLNQADAERAAEIEHQKAELQRTLLRQNAWIAVLEQRSAVSDDRADQAEVNIHHLRDRAERAEAEVLQLRAQTGKSLGELELSRRQLAEAEAAVQSLRIQATESQHHALTREAALQAELHRLTRLLTERDSAVAALESKLRNSEEQLAAAVDAENETTAQDLASLEHQLGERAQQMQELERELREARRVGRELIRQLESQLKQSVGPAAQLQELSTQLASLSSVLAQREADLLAAGWTVDALSARLEQAEGFPRTHAQ